MAMQGGHLLVQSLLALGARHSFGIPGESYLAALDGLYDTQGQLDFMICRNEGGASFMAAAYGKLTGRPGICWVTRGPGAANAAIGVHTAYQDSAPMLLLVGQVGRDHIGREAFQEVDFRAMFGDLAKWVVQIDSADRIPEIIAKAYTRALSGRPGPVVVALPEDMLRDHSDQPPVRGPVALGEPAPTPNAMADLHNMLRQSQNPLMIVGGCNWTDAGRIALQNFAQQSDMPVAVAFRYQDQFDNHSPCYVGEAGVAMPAQMVDVIRRADLILAVNTRLGEMTTGGFELLDCPNPRQTLIHVHSSDLELGKTYQPALAIHSGPNSFAHALAPVPIGWADWRKQARHSYKQSLSAPTPTAVDNERNTVNMGEVSAWLRAHLPDNVIVTNGAGNFTLWPNKFLQYGPSARLLAPQSGAMGYGVPAAIMAKLVHPDRMVLCFAGDGDFQMNCQELASAKQYGAQPIILLLNNGSYGTIASHQNRHYPGRAFGTTMSDNPDFIALARAYGFYGQRVDKTADFAAAFDAAKASLGGAVLELMV